MEQEIARKAGPFNPPTLAVLGYQNRPSLHTHHTYHRNFADAPQKKDSMRFIN